MERDREREGEANEADEEEADDNDYKNEREWYEERNKRTESE